MSEIIELIDLGWDSTNHQLKISYIEETNSVRLNKVGDNNHNLPGPQVSLDKIPELIDILSRIYSEHNNE